MWLASCFFSALIHLLSLPQCGKVAPKEEYIVINGTAEDMKALAGHIAERRAAAKAAKVSVL